MPPPSTTATKSKDERKRAWQKGHNRSCVLKVVDQALLHPNPISSTTTSACASATVPMASTSSTTTAATMPSSTNTVIMSEAAREALVACHWAFIAEATAGMAQNYRNDGHEVYTDEDDNDGDNYDDDNDDDKPKKRKKKKTKVGFNATTRANLAAKLHDMGCADLWNTALSLNQATTTTPATKRGGGGGGPGDAKKRKKNKALDMDMLQAEQDRLLETSRLAALSQKQHQEQQKQPPAAP